jgi:hypothetical protein
MLRGTLAIYPRALPQTISYLAYFIHLREYAERVIAQDWRFNYCLDEVNTSENLFGEGGRINMVKQVGNGSPSLIDSSSEVAG